MQLISMKFSHTRTPVQIHSWGPRVFIKERLHTYSSF